MIVFLVSKFLFLVVPLQFFLHCLRLIYYHCVHRRRLGRIEGKYQKLLYSKKGNRITSVLQGDNLHIGVGAVISRSLLNDPIYIGLWDESVRELFIFQLSKLILKYNSDFTVISKDYAGDKKDVITSCSVWIFSKTGDSLNFAFDYFSQLIPNYTLKEGLTRTFRKYIRTSISFARWEFSRKEIMKDQAERGYYYLIFMSTEPLCFGKGYGSDNLERMTKLADKENRCLYCESTNKRNLTFYKRHGFEVVRKAKFVVDVDNDVDTYHLRRDPRN